MSACSSGVVQSTDLTADTPQLVDADATLDADAAGEGLPIRDLESRLVAAVCLSVLQPDWLASCIDFYGDWQSEALRQRIRLVERAALHYDALAAKHCVDGLVRANAQAGWETVSAFRADPLADPALPATCNQVFTGELPIGAACDDDAQCAGGRCWGVAGATHCTPTPPTGGSCGPFAGCAAGDLCVSGTCIPASVTLPEGATCQVGSAPQKNDIFNSQQRCDKGLNCREASHTGIWRCQPAVALGGACADADECAGQSVCAKGKCANLTAADFVQACGTETCTPVSKCQGTPAHCVPLLQPGATCSADGHCVHSTCMAGTTKACSLTSPCEPSCASPGCNENGKCILARIQDSCASDAECVGVDDSMAGGLRCFSGQCRRAWNPAMSWSQP